MLKKTIGILLLVIGFSAIINGETKPALIFLALGAIIFKLAMKKK